MSKLTEPLKDGEVGSFGELSSRPNLDGLAILTIPTFEDMIPFLEQQAGHALSPDDVEAARQKSPAMVVTQEVATEMKAVRLQRHPLKSKT